MITAGQIWKKAFVFGTCICESKTHSYNPITNKKENYEGQLCQVFILDINPANLYGSKCREFRIGVGPEAIKTAQGIQQAIDKDGVMCADIIVSSKIISTKIGMMEVNEFDSILNVYPNISPSVPLKTPKL